MKSNTRMGIDCNRLRMLRFGFPALAGIAAIPMYIGIVTGSGCVDVVPAGVVGSGPTDTGTSGGQGGDDIQVGNPLLRIAPGDHVQGSEEAQVTIIEYGDFQ